jgi:hypothetical protein
MEYFQVFVGLQRFYFHLFWNNVNIIILSKELIMCVYTIFYYFITVCNTKRIWKITADSSVTHVKYLIVFCLNSKVCCLEELLDVGKILCDKENCSTLKHRFSDQTFHQNQFSVPPLNYFPSFLLIYWIQQFKPDLHILGSLRIYV